MFFPVILGIVILLTVGAIWRGYVFSVLWKWFIVPFGASAGVTVPLLSIPMAIGISMVITFLAFQHVYTEDNRSTSDKMSGALGVSLFYPALVLLMGWIVTLFL